MLAGDAKDIVQWRTSFDRDLNERGYDDYTVDSPATDADYTPNDATPNWDYRVVYEAWVDHDAFGSSGFGGATIEHVHASPSKAPSNTITVVPGDCPCVKDGGCGKTPPSCADTPYDSDCEPFSCEDHPEHPDCQLL